MTMTDRNIAESIERVLRIALEEDAADQDRTSALVDADKRVRGEIVGRARTVVAGITAVRFLGDVSRIASDGDVVEGTVAEFEGNARQVLSRERSVLNLLGRLSGIATMTRTYVARIAPGSKTKILDTRKTTPGLRVLEKYAVRCGGGFNHRMDLSEMIFIKDNHLKCLASPRGADVIEVDRIDQIEPMLALAPKRLLLDNFSDNETHRALEVIAGRCEVEVSGGITRDRVETLSRLGVDYISVGAITHSAPCADFSLELV